MKAVLLILVLFFYSSIVLGGTKPTSEMSEIPIQIGHSIDSDKACVIKVCANESLVINAGNGEIVLHPDGKVELKNVTLDKAAQEFWEKVSAAFPQFKENILKEERETGRYYKTPTEAEILLKHLDIIHKNTGRDNAR